MEKYVKIFTFDAMEKISEGKTVYVVDRKRREVFCVNEMTMGDFAEMVNAKGDSGRLDFWYENEEETNGAI